MDNIKIGIVNYLNTKPLLYGLKNNSKQNNIEIFEDYPSKISDFFLQDKIDIALLPVAILPKLSQYFFVSNYCIGATNEVASVSLFSQVPLSQIQNILLDYQSKTSVSLVKILCKHFWKISPNFIEADKDYINKISNTTAAVIIGDRALQYKNRFNFDNDLAAEWIHFTQLPFVFATWISKSKTDENFIIEFDKMQSIGLNKIDEIATKNEIEFYSLKKYYTQNISYNFDENKKKGLNLFLELLKTIQ